MQDSSKNILNVLFSTNACFIVTTGLGIKKDSYAAGSPQFSTDFPYFIIILGQCISVALTVCLHTTDLIPSFIYKIGLAISFLSCIYLAYIYTKESMRKEEIIQKYEQEEQFEAVKKMLSAKQESSFSMAGEDYKL